MTCGHCEQTVEDSLEAISGVRETPLWDLGSVADADAVSINTTDPTSVEGRILDTD